MNKIQNVFSILFLVWILSMLTLILCGKVTFGHGIGDLLYLFLLVIFLIVFLFFFFSNLKRKIKMPILISFLTFLIIMLLFTLKMTIWRGVEYPWNGQIFYK